MFGAKQRMIDQLAHSVSTLQRRNDRQADEIKSLRQTIRDMDQLILQMANQPSWGQMQPFFANLCEGTMVRKRIESDRINQLLHGELNKPEAP